MKKSKKKSKTIRYGIIGFGAHAEQCYAVMLLEAKAVENATITAITEPNPVRRKAMQPNYDKSIKWFSDYKDMLNKKYIDAIIITSPHPFHCEMVIECLKRNIPVMCEKPAATCTKDVLKMIEASKNSKALFGMMFNQRTNCLYRKCREMIKDGAIGEIRRINWVITNWFRADKYYKVAPNRATWAGEGGGLIINQACHQVDLLQWIVDEMPIKVHGFLGCGKWHDIECDDEFTLVLDYKNGSSGTFISSTGEYPGVNRLEISGTKGRLTVQNNELTYYELETDSRVFSIEAKGAYDLPKYTIHKIQTDGKNPQHRGIIQNFTNALLGKEKLEIPGSEGLKAIEIINAAIYSYWHNSNEVTIPIDPETYYEELQHRIAISRYSIRK